MKGFAPAIRLFQGEHLDRDEVGSYKLQTLPLSRLSPTQRRWLDDSVPNPEGIPDLVGRMVDSYAGEGASVCFGTDTSARQQREYGIEYPTMAVIVIPGDVRNISSLASQKRSEGFPVVKLVPVVADKRVRGSIRDSVVGAVLEGIGSGVYPFTDLMSSLGGIRPIIVLDTIGDRGGSKLAPQFPGREVRDSVLRGAIQKGWSAEGQEVQELTGRMTRTTLSVIPPYKESFGNHGALVLARRETHYSSLDKTRVLGSVLNVYDATITTTAWSGWFQDYRTAEEVYDSIEEEMENAVHRSVHGAQAYEWHPYTMYPHRDIEGRGVSVERRSGFDSVDCTMEEGELGSTLYKTFVRMRYGKEIRLPSYVRTVLSKAV